MKNLSIEYCNLVTNSILKNSNYFSQNRIIRCSANVKRQSFKSHSVNNMSYLELPRDNFRRLLAILVENSKTSMRHRNSAIYKLSFLLTMQRYRLTPFLCAANDEFYSMVWDLIIAKCKRWMWFVRYDLDKKSCDLILASVLCNIFLKKWPNEAKKECECWKDKHQLHGAFRNYNEMSFNRIYLLG